jgi:hypothetical protein
LGLYLWEFLPLASLRKIPKRRSFNGKKSNKNLKTSGPRLKTTLML